MADNEVYRIRLGWTYAELRRSLGKPEFLIDSGIVHHKDYKDRILAFQVESGLHPDGVMGPKTYLRFLAQFGGLGTPGEVAVANAKMLWLADTIDPKGDDVRDQASRDAIDAFIRTGLGWTWTPKYLKDGDFQWCGAFLAHAYSFAKLRADVRKTFCSSTYRLDCLGRGLAHEGREPPKAKRLYRRFDERAGPGDLDGIEVLPGDVLLVGGGGRAYGDHVTLVERYDEVTGVFHTIEGNAVGAGPRGNKREGVIRTTRPLGLDPGQPRSMYHARRLLRFAPEDFES